MFRFKLYSDNDAEKIECASKGEGRGRMRDSMSWTQLVREYRKRTTDGCDRFEAQSWSNFDRNLNPYMNDDVMYNLWTDQIIKARIVWFVKQMAQFNRVMDRLESYNAQRNRRRNG